MVVKKNSKPLGLWIILLNVWLSIFIIIGLLLSLLFFALNDSGHGSEIFLIFPLIFLAFVISLFYNEYKRNKIFKILAIIVLLIIALISWDLGEISPFESVISRLPLLAISFAGIIYLLISKRVKETFVN